MPRADVPSRVNAVALIEKVLCTQILSENHPKRACVRLSMFRQTVTLLPYRESKREYQRLGQ